MAVGRRLARTARGLVWRLLARYPQLGRPASIRFAAEALPRADPWDAIQELRRTMSGRDAVRVVLGLASPDLPFAALLDVEGDAARLYALRAAVGRARSDPFATKADVLVVLLGPNRRRAYGLVPIVARTFNLAEATTVLATTLPDALAAVDPYAPSRQRQAARSVASILSLYPTLLDEMIDAAGTEPDRLAALGDIALDAAQLDGLFTRQDLPRVASLVARTADELPERLRTADNRYSTSDPVGPAPQHRLGLLRTALGAVSRTASRVRAGPFPTRLAVLAFVDLICVVAAMALANSVGGVAGSGGRPDVAPPIDLSTGLTAAGLLVALHVLAVELASGSLPIGMVTSVAWPARLVSAYAMVAAILVTQLLPTPPEGLSLGFGVALLIHLPFVARDLVSKSDLRRAASRVWRDRSADFGRTGVEAAHVYRQRQALNEFLVGRPIRFASVEPVTRRRVPVAAQRDGYLVVDFGRLQELDRVLAQAGTSPLRSGSPAPDLVLLHQPGSEVAAGDALAVIEVDEPDLAEQALPLSRRAFATQTLAHVDRSRNAVGSLSAS